MISLIREYELAFGNPPGEPVNNQVIYVDNGLNPDFKAFVEKHLDKIKKMFSEQGLEFIYLKDWIRNVSDEELHSTFKYYVPWLKKEDLDFLRNACEININELGRKLIPSEQDDSIIAADGHAFKIIVKDPRLYMEQLYQIARAYGRKTSNQRKLSPMVVNESMECSISLFDEDDELTRMFRQVRNLLPEWVVREMLAEKLKNQETLSSVYISRNNVMKLPEYDIEIQLRPKEMALYILFLRHPEGIEFKKLIEHRDELLRYYRHFANRGTSEEQANAIDNLVDPLNYSGRDTQRSRIQRAIKDAFTDKFCQYYAQYYIIDGRQGEPKYIKIAQQKDKVRLEDI